MTLDARAMLAASLLAWTAAGSAAAQPAAPSEPTRIIWSNPADPQLAQFQDTAAACRAEAVARFPVPEESEPAAAQRGTDGRRQQHWLDCMKARGYEPREVSGP